MQGRHKKQSGGHGQFGDVWIEFEPYDTDDLEFAERVVGGAVPKNFFPAVEKGLRDAIKKGVLAGYPTVGIKAARAGGEEGEETISNAEVFLLLHHLHPWLSPPEVIIQNIASLY